MVLILNGCYLTEEGSEIIMAFLNIVLEMAKMQFRFPRKKRTSDKDITSIIIFIM